eukprot:jgi/Ulvmu1/12579/UM092_0009.1
MAESQVNRASRKRSHVTLTNDAPLQGEDAIVVGERICESAAKRSELLSGIQNTEGLAELPRSISPADVRLWQAACIFASDPPTEELVRVLKVADALGDTDIDNWTNTLSTRVLSTTWTNTNDADEMVGSLLLLPNHLLQAVLARCITTSGHSYKELAPKLPLTLHRPLLAAAITSGHTSIAVGDAGMPACAFLDRLESTPLPAPGLRELLADPSLSITPTAAALFARACCAHTTLTSLHLTHHYMPPAALRALGSGLALSPPPALDSLRLHFDLQPSAAVALAECLRPLSALVTLGARMRLPVGTPVTTTPIQSYSYLAAAPVVLPCLQKLRLQERHDGGPAASTSSHLGLVARMFSTPALVQLLLTSSAADASDHFAAAIGHHSTIRCLILSARFQDTQQGVSPAWAALRLPSLIQVHIQSPCARAPLALASRLATAIAPSVTALGVKPLHHIVATWVSQDMGRDDAALQRSWCDFMASAARCDRLRELKLWRLGHRDPEHRFSRALVSALTALTALTLIRLQAESKHTRVRAQLNAAAFFGALHTLPALRALYLCSGSGRLSFDSTAVAWEGLVGLPGLHRLGLTFHGVELPTAAALMPQLPALTSLELRPQVFIAANETRDEFQAQFPAVTIHEWKLPTGW